MNINVTLVSLVLEYVVYSKVNGNIIVPILKEICVYLKQINCQSNMHFAKKITKHAITLGLKYHYYLFRTIFGLFWEKRGNILRFLSKAIYRYVGGKALSFP